jgi:hypothetical protein
MILAPRSPVPSHDELLAIHGRACSVSSTPPRPRIMRRGNRRSSFVSPNFSRCSITSSRYPLDALCYFSGRPHTFLQVLCVISAEDHHHVWPWPQQPRQQCTRYCRACCEQRNGCEVCAAQAPQCKHSSCRAGVGSVTVLVRVGCVCTWLSWWWLHSHWCMWAHRMSELLSDCVSSNLLLRKSSYIIVTEGPPNKSIPQVSAVN